MALNVEEAAEETILNAPPFLQNLRPGVLDVSESPTKIEAQSASRTLNPLKNPSYPQRTHLHEKPRWQEVLQSCDDRIAKARQKFNVLGNSPNRAAFERLFSQMLGARDQVADAVRRIPMETGDLYAEDCHRVERAVAALDRVFQRWDAQKA